MVFCNPITKASVLGAIACSLVACRSTGWQPLMRPGDLEGWHATEGGQWRWRDDVLIGTSESSEERHGMLISDERFSDFRARLDFRIRRLRPSARHNL